MLARGTIERSKVVVAAGDARPQSTIHLVVESLARLPIGGEAMPTMSRDFH